MVKSVKIADVATVGYLSTLAAWLGDAYMVPGADLSLVLGWLYEAGLKYLEERDRDFLKEVWKKQERFSSDDRSSDAA